MVDCCDGGDMRELWRGLRQELAGLVLPVGCAGCGLPHGRSQLCEECRGALRSAVPRRVWPSRVPSGLPPVYGAMPYADEVRAVLLAHKERGALGLAVPLGALLAAAVRAAVGAVPVRLVPVPSARRAVAGRGHDPARRVASAAARVLREGGVLARTVPVLRQRRAVADQAGLTAGQRLANLGGALEVVPGGGSLLGRPEEGETVLVDDVMTTGASLVESVRALGAAGRGVAAAAVVAVRAAP